MKSVFGFKMNEIVGFNPVHVTNLFLYPLETLEIYDFLMFSGCKERDD